jgi:hypothetical protein
MLLKSSNNRVGTSFEELIQTVLEVHLGKGAIERNPNGNKKQPDFRVTFPNGNTVDLEAKTSKTGMPMWNCGIPQVGTVYIYSRTTTGEVTFFLGEDSINSQETAKLLKFAEDYKQLCKQFNVESSSSGSPWGVFGRKMFTSKEKPCVHKDRQTRENRVLTFVVEQERGK